LPTRRTERLLKVFMDESLLTYIEDLVEGADSSKYKELLEERVPSLRYLCHSCAAATRLGSISH
jgi:hypothetical protein